MAPAITDFFGANAQVITTTEGSLAATTANPYLVIRYSDLAAIGLWNTLQAGHASKPEKWFAALMNLIANYTANADDSAKVTVSAATIGNGTRDGGNAYLRFSHTVQIFTTQITATQADPDDVA